MKSDPTPVATGGNMFSGRKRSAKPTFPFGKEEWGPRTTARVAGTAYNGCQALTPGCVLTAVSAFGLPNLLKRIMEQPPTTDLIAALENVEDIATERQLKDAVGASQAAVAAEKAMNRKGMGNLLSEVRACENNGGRSSAKGHTDDAEDPTASESDSGAGATDEMGDGIMRKRRRYATGQITKPRESPGAGLSRPV